jgi:hypothetical protein
MLGGPAPVLVALAPQIAAVGVGVGKVAGGREVDDGLGDFTEAGSHPDGQPHDEEEPHRPGTIVEPRSRLQRTGAKDPVAIGYLSHDPGDPRVKVVAIAP